MNDYVNGSITYYNKYVKYIYILFLIMLAWLNKFVNNKNEKRFKHAYSYHFKI